MIRECEFQEFQEAVESLGLPTDRIERFGSSMSSWTSDDGSSDSALVYHNADSPFNPTDLPYWEWRTPEGRKASTEFSDLLASTPKTGRSRSTLLKSSEGTLRSQTFTIEERLPSNSSRKYFVGKINGVACIDKPTYGDCLLELLIGIPAEESLPLRIKFAVELRGLGSYRG